MHEVTRLLRQHKFALVVTGVALAGTLLTWPISQRFPFALFIAAVMVAAWRGGFKPGLVTTGLSALALLLLYVLLLSPRKTDRSAQNVESSARPAETEEHFFIRLGMFGLIGLLAGYLSMKCRQAVLAHDRFHDTLTSLGEALIFTDAHGVITFLNPMAQTLTGCAPDEASGKPLGQVLSLIHEDKRQPIDDPAARALSDNTASVFPEGSVLVSKSGLGTPVEGKAIPLRDADERMVGVAVAFHAAAARRQAEQELRQQEQRLRTAVASCPAALLLLDAEGRCLFSNRAAQLLGGFSSDEALGQGWTRCIYLQDRDRVLNDWTAALHTEAGEYAVEFRMQGVSNEPRWLRLRAASMESIDGHTLGHVAVLEDITARKLAEEKRHESEAQLATATARQKQIDETLSRLRDDLQRQVQAGADAQRQAQEKLTALEAATRQLEEARDALTRQLEESQVAQRQAEEALERSRDDFVRLLDEHTAARRRAEEGLQRARDDFSRQLEEHSEGRRQAEEALRKQRDEFAPQMEERAATQRKTEEMLQAVRSDYEKQLEKLTSDFLNDMAGLEEKLTQSRQTEGAAREEAEALRQQLAASHGRVGALEQENDSHRQSAEALAHEKGHLETLMHHAPDGLCAFDREGRYTFWNPTMERLTGIASTAALGRTASEVFALTPDDDATRHIRDALEGKRGTILLRAPTAFGAGEPTWLEKSYAPLHGADRVIVGGVAIVRTATPPSQAEPPTPPVMQRATETNGPPEPPVLAVAGRRPPDAGDWLSYN
jgi:PAS domain S-box-containing protein